MNAHTDRMQGKKIGFVGVRCTTMATGADQGLLHSKTVDARLEIRASDVKPERLEELHVAGSGSQTTGEDNEALARWADVVVIAVKPQIVDRILEPISKGDPPRPISSCRSPPACPSRRSRARLPPKARRHPRDAQHRRAIALAGSRHRRSRPAPTRPSTTSRSRALPLRGGRSLRRPRRVAARRGDRPLREWPCLRDDDHRGARRRRREGRPPGRDTSRSSWPRRPSTARRPSSSSRPASTLVAIKDPGHDEPRRHR